MKIKVCRVSDFPETGAILLQGTENPLAVVRHGASYFAFDELCPHRGGPLSEGAVLQGCIECPWHKSRFELSTGKQVSGPAAKDLKCHQVFIDDEVIFLDDGC